MAVNSHSDLTSILDLTMPNEHDHPTASSNTVIDLTIDSDPVFIDLMLGSNSEASQATSLAKSMSCDASHACIDCTCQGSARSKATERPDRSGGTVNVANNRDNTVVHLININVTLRVGLDLLLAEIGKKYGFEADFIHKIYAGAAGL